MIAQTAAAVNVKARLEEARDTRDFVIRQIHRAEAARNWTEAAEWQVELRGVEREIHALVGDRGW